MGASGFEGGRLGRQGSRLGVWGEVRSPGGAGVRGSRPGTWGRPAGGRQPSPGGTVGILHLRGEEGTLGGTVLPSPSVLYPVPSSPSRRRRRPANYTFHGQTSSGREGPVSPLGRVLLHLPFGVCGLAGAAAAPEFSESRARVSSENEGGKLPGN